MNLDEKWLWSAPDVARLLGVTEKDFGALIAGGSFPDGIVRGKRNRQWTSEDVRWMRYRLANDGRFRNLDKAAAADLEDEIANQ